MGILETIGAVFALIVAAIGGIFAIYDRFSKPDIKAGNDINLLQQGCELKHQGIDKTINDINTRFDRMENNHINHIEADLRNINITQERILTILEAKYQLKVR